MARERRRSPPPAHRSSVRSRSYVDFKSRGKKPKLSLTYRRNRNETDQVYVFDLDQWI